MVRIGCVGLAKICCVPAHNRASVHSDSLIPRKENQGTKYNNNVGRKKKKKVSYPDTELLHHWRPSTPKFWLNL